MAFNPFESFRKNSKALLALLTIFIMFVFVLSSGIGGGDFFDWLTRQFGGKDSRGAEMGEIDGHEYHAQDLQEVRQQRMAANVFMIAAINEADAMLLNQIEQDLKNNLIRKEEIKQDLEVVKRRITQTIQFAQILGQSQEQIAGDFAQMSAMMYAAANDPLLNDRDHAAEKRNLRRASKVYDHYAMIVGFGGRLFFGEIPNQNDQQALEYLAVLKEADKMDLKFTEDDVKKMIADETDGVLNDEATARRVDDAVRRDIKMTPEKILRAIGQEYRMRTVLGIMRGRNTMPAAQTPYEFYEFYKDKCTPVRFELADISVEKYIPLVKAEPTDKEIRELYDLFARVEWDPAKATPGFKEPRKAKVEYIGIDDTLPLYQKAPPYVKAATTATYPLQAISGGNAFTSGLFAAAPLIAQPLSVRENMDRDPMVSALRQQEIVSRTQHGRPEIPSTIGVNATQEALALSRMLGFIRENRFADSYATPADILSFHPLPLASLTAHLATANHPLAAAASAVTGMRNTTRLLDARARILAGMQVAVSPLPSNPAFGFTSSIAALANLPTLSENFWLGLYLENQRTNKAIERHFALADFNRLQEKLNDIRKKLAPPEDKEKKKDDFTPTPKKKDAFKPKPEDIKKANDEARALIDQFVKEHTFKDQPSVRHGQSKELRDQYHMQDDPGLETLSKLFFDPKPYTRYQEAFFKGVDPKEDLNAKLYTPTIFPESSVSENSFRGPTYLAWRIEDEHAKQVPYDKITPEMKAQVVRAWKIKKARDLANDDAQKLAEKLKGLAQKNLIDSDNLPAFEREMDNVVIPIDMWKRLSHVELAMLNEHPPIQANTRPSFMLPAIRNPDIPYPLSSQEREDMFSPAGRDQWNGRIMANQMLEIRNKPLGESVIITDTPNMHYYVAVMVRKTPPSVASFYQVFRLMRAPNARSQNPFDQPKDYFYGRFQLETRVNQDRDVFARIKADVKYKETDELKKSLEKRANE